MSRYLVCLSFCAGLFAVGCNSDKGQNFGAPMVKPPVDDSTPDALKSDGSGLRTPISTETLNMSGVARLQKALTDSRGAINGGTCNGIVGCSLQALDVRIAEVNKRTEENKKKCQDAAAVDYKFGVLNESLTLKVQCHDIFADNGTHGDNSGIIFGKSGDLFSIGMTLQQSEGMYAYVATYDQATDVVNFLEPYFNTGTTVATTSLTRLQANRKDKSYELAYAASSDGYGLMCGVHMISDGTTIFAKGRFPTTNDQECADVAEETLCVKASDLSAVSGDCPLSAANFKLNDLTAEAVADAADDFASVMGAKKYAEVGTGSFGEDSE